MQNPDELIMLFENPSSKHTHILRQTSASSHTHANTHTNRHTWDAPSLHDMFLSVPSYSLVLSFHGRQGGKKKETWKTQKKRQLEERDEGEERMCLFRRSADMKQVLPVNFSTAIPPLLPAAQSHFSVLCTSAPSLPPRLFLPIWVILSPIYLFRCTAGTEQGEKSKTEKEKKGSLRQNTRRGESSTPNSPGLRSPTALLPTP